MDLAEASKKIEQMKLEHDIADLNADVRRAKIDADYSEFKSRVLMIDSIVSLLPFSPSPLLPSSPPPLLPSSPPSLLPSSPYSLSLGHLFDPPKRNAKQKKLAKKVRQEQKELEDREVKMAKLLLDIMYVSATRWEGGREGGREGGSKVINRA